MNRTLELIDLRWGTSKCNKHPLFNSADKGNWEIVLEEMILGHRGSPFL